MNICVFDTETCNLEKPFCYNIGYQILDTETNPWTVLLEKDFVVEQVWHNPMLFITAYYADKRPIYISSMRGRKTKMDKFGYITQEMYRDFKTFSVAHAYAYNSSFDEKVFNFNSDWFKCINPFDTVQIHDIRGFACKVLVTDDYRNFCEANNLFTESGNYSTTAEAMYKYISQNTEFIEAHTALNDSQIESQILERCTREEEIDITADIPCPRSIPRKVKRTFRVRRGKEIIFETECEKIIFYKGKGEVRLN